MLIQGGKSNDGNVTGLDLSTVRASNGTHLYAFDEQNRKQDYLVEAAQRVGGVLLGSGNYANPTPVINSPYEHNETANRNAIGAHDDIYIRAVTLAEAIAEDAPVGTRYTITDLDNARYDVVASDDVGGFYKAGLVSGRKLRLLDVSKILGYGNIQDFIDGARPSGVVSFGFGSLPASSDIKLTAQVEINKKSVVMDLANSNLRSAPSANSSIFHVTDSSRCRFENGVLLGDINNLPYAAFHFEGLGGVAGTNENATINSCIIGRRYGTDTTTGGSADDTPQFRFDNGIVVNGAVDGNNDEYTIRNTQVHSCLNYGILFANFQGIWSQIENTLVNDCNVGVRLGCSMNLINPSFNRNKVADIEAFRTVEIRINNLQAENSKKLFSSSQSASLKIDGGRCLRNDTEGRNIIEFISGGNAYIRGGLTLNNSGGGADKIYWRNGGSTKWDISLKDFTVLTGYSRDYIDIDTGAFGGVDPSIDIDCKHLKLKTSLPYLDREFDVGSIPSESQLVTAFGSSNIILGDLINVSCGSNLNGVCLSPLITSDANARFSLTNLSGASVDLPKSRYRLLSLADKVRKQVITNVSPSFMSNGTGQTIDIPFEGVSLGDFVSVMGYQGWNNIFVSAYVKDTNIVSLKIHNATGGGSAPSSGNVKVGLLKNFGDLYSKSVASTNVSNGASTTIDVNCKTAKLGSHVFFSYDKDLKGLVASCNCSSDGVVTVSMYNRTGADVTIDPGTLSIMTYA